MLECKEIGNLQAGEFWACQAESNVISCGRASARTSNIPYELHRDTQCTGGEICFPCDESDLECSRKNRGGEGVVDSGDESSERFRIGHPARSH